ncbi:MAG: prenyltransferase [Thermodesulfobacteriota bacterium]|nr:MAG: prenyltransferase [Thermodesulfobacteriota bacterium]
MIKRNHPLREESDRINAIQSGCCRNLRKLLRFFFFSHFFGVEKRKDICLCQGDKFTYIQKMTFPGITILGDKPDKGDWKNEGKKMVKSGSYKKLKAWFQLSRPPFHTVGVLPFVLGTFLAWRLGGLFNGIAFVLGVAAVVLIMLSTYYAGEYFDYREDELSQRVFKSRFAGGSGVISAGILPRRVSLWGSIITLGIAGIIGLGLQYYFLTGPYTLVLGCLGAFPGFFYSTRPIRLVERGFGELFIGFCYGWLPIAVAFYIQCGYIDSVIHWIGIPIGCTIFNVIFLNEYHDYHADKTVGKNNLLARLGLKKGVILYASLSLLTWAAAALSIAGGVPRRLFYFCLPFTVISAWITVMMMKGKYKNRHELEKLCGWNIAVNLGTTASYILSFV